MVQHTKTGKIVPNGHKLYQTAIKYTKWPSNVTISSIARPSKHFPKFGVFGLKICHLATLPQTDLCEGQGLPDGISALQKSKFLVHFGVPWNGK
jgi:hypothetical protein